MYVYYFHNAGAAFAVPKYSRHKVNLYHSIMLALHLQCQNIFNFSYVNMLFVCLLTDDDCSMTAFQEKKTSYSNSDFFVVDN